MSPAKIICLVSYAILGVLAFGVAGAQAAGIATWIIAALVAAHLVEMVVFFKLCREAPGSTAGNLFQVFLFGIFHKQQMETGTAA